MTWICHILQARFHFDLQSFVDCTIIITEILAMLAVYTFYPEVFILRREMFQNLTTEISNKISYSPFLNLQLFLCTLFNLK